MARTVAAAAAAEQRCEAAKRGAKRSLDLAEERQAQVWRRRRSWSARQG